MNNDQSVDNQASEPAVGHLLKTDLYYNFLNKFGLLEKRAVTRTQHIYILVRF